MSVLITLITGALVAAPLVALIVAWRRLHVRLRTRGYGRLQIATVFSVLLAACYATFGGLVAASAGGAPPAGGLAALIFFVPPLLWIVLAAAIARIAPPRIVPARIVPARRPKRVSGRRRSRIPYRVLGWLTRRRLAMAAFFVWQFFFGDIVHVGRLPEVCWHPHGARTRCWRILGGRLKAAPVVLPEIKGSVLYLRAFGDENRPFVTGPASKLGRYTDQLVSKTAVRRSRQDPTIRLTLEDYLGEAIVAQLGPFVALGNPIDSLPPDGAIREYAPDGAWQERFTQLSQDARCIVIALSESENLQWELQWIGQSRMSQKLCLFTPPRPPRKNEFGAQLKALHEDASQRDSLASTWASAVDALQRAGYACDPACPGPGARSPFDEAGGAFC